MDAFTTGLMKIIIIGGGTSGWMTAAALCNHTEHEIVMIDGGEPIGVGESTTPHINQYLRFMGISDEQMIPNNVVDCQIIQQVKPPPIK